MFLQHVLCPEALKSKSFSTMAPMGHWLSKDFEEPSSTCGCSSLTAQHPKQVTLPKKKKRIIFQDWFFQKPNKLSDYNVTWVMFTKWSHPTTKSAWSHQCRTFQGCYPIVAPATSFFTHGDNETICCWIMNFLNIPTSVPQKMVANIANLYPRYRWIKIANIFQSEGSYHLGGIPLATICGGGALFSGLQTSLPATDSEHQQTLQVFWFRKRIE